MTGPLAWQARRLQRRFRAELAGLTAVCRCTHLRIDHEHYRPGADCGRCGKAACPAYRRQRRFKIIFWR